jgi:hypothetical protein
MWGNLFQGYVVSRLFMGWESPRDPRVLIYTGQPFRFFEKKTYFCKERSPQSRVFSLP